jgi:hypothetical protein
MPQELRSIVVGSDAPRRTPNTVGVRPALHCGTARATVPWPSRARGAAPVLPPRPSRRKERRRRPASAVRQPRGRGDNCAMAVPQLRDHDRAPSLAVPQTLVRSGRLLPASRVARMSPARLCLWSAPRRPTGTRLKSTSCAGRTTGAPEDPVWRHPHGAQRKKQDRPQRPPSPLRQSLAGEVRQQVGRLLSPRGADGADARPRGE